MTDPTAQSLRCVLSGLAFPAERWAIVTTAAVYGADTGTCERLRQLPLRHQAYLNIQEIVEALKMVPTQRPVRRVELMSGRPRDGRVHHHDRVKQVRQADTQRSPRLR